MPVKGRPQFPPETQLQFRVDLEDDPVKNAQLGAIFSKPSEGQDSKDGSEITRNESSNSASYLDFEITTAQRLETTQEGRFIFLLVLHVHFHPCIGWDFHSATITWKFSGPTAQNHSAELHSTGTSKWHDNVHVLAHAPRKSFGGLTTETKNLVWGLELPLVCPLPFVELGITPSVTSGAAKEIEHSMTITGIARGVPMKKYVVWTLEQNQSSRSGLPEVQLAAVVRSEAETVRCLVDVKARLFRKGILRVTRHLRAKCGDNGNVINAEKLRGKLKEFDMEDDGISQEGWRKWLQKWTGKVGGCCAVWANYSSPVVRYRYTRRRNAGCFFLIVHRMVFYIHSGTSRP